jgi:GDP-4-dehydro-6-deoxy-D-mannose reductase
MSGFALVTGAGGFVGRTLCTYLSSRGWEVRGGVWPEEPSTPAQIACDVRDTKHVERMLEWAGSVTHVFHLAAMAFVPSAIAEPVAAMEVNLQGTIHLSHALRRLAPSARLVYIGSAEVYGLPKNLPITEEFPLCPEHPYAISKAAADQYLAFLHRSARANVVRVRPFNHSGPGQPEQFVLASFARQIAEIEAGRSEPRLCVGNLQAARDFLHVKDVVRAYELAALKGISGEAYNVCSGRARTIGEALDLLLGMAKAEVRVEAAPERFRAVDTPKLVGSHEKLTAHTGWHPEIPFEKLLEDLLQDWRERFR